MKITVKIFAALKDYFEQEILLEVENNISVSLVIEKLAAIRPDSKAVLAKCRIAVNEEFVSPQYILKNEEHVYLIPPSSGG